MPPAARKITPPAPKCALITTFVGRTRDRFHEYNAPKTLEEKLQIVSRMDGITGVECIFPYLLAWTGGPLAFFYVGSALNAAAIVCWLAARPREIAP